METWERLEYEVRLLIPAFVELWELIEAVKQMVRQPNEETFQELSELASEVDRTATQTERKRENTPYKPKFKPLRRDKRLTMQRCRSHCATDKTHKIARQSSFVLSIPKEGKSRYNYYVITVLALLFHKNRILLSRAYCIVVALTLHTIRFFSKEVRMKDANKLKNYRQKYKRYYGIEFGKDFVVHHIDFNHENDDISNLVLLPRELHERYHAILNAISISPDKPKADGLIDVRLSNGLVTDYCAVSFEQLPQIIAECNKWMRYKREGYRYTFPDGYISLGKEHERKTGVCQR